MGILTKIGGKAQKLFGKLLEDDEEPTVIYVPAPPPAPLPTPVVAMAKRGRGRPPKMKVQEVVVAEAKGMVGRNDDMSALPKEGGKLPSSPVNSAPPKIEIPEAEWKKVKPKKAIMTYQAYLIEQEKTFHTKVQLHEFEYKTMKKRLYYLQHNGFNYPEEEVEEQFGDLNPSSCNFMFLENASKTERGKLILGKADFSEKAWEEIHTLDSSKVEDREAESTFHEGRARYSMRNMGDFVLMMLLFGIVMFLVLTPTMSNLGGIISATADASIRVQNYSDTQLPPNSVVVMPPNKTYVVNGT